jgi:ABC-2 type transport system ATP-binding protein
MNIFDYRQDWEIGRPLASSTAPERLALDIRGLKKSYGNTVALDGIDISVKYGEVLGILGPNGAGKTTLLEILEGITPFDAGQVSFLGCDVGRNPEQLRGKINVTMQGGSLPPTLLVRELISLYLSIYKSTEPMSEILERVGLTQKSDSRISRLSGGQRQRLALALALIGKSGMLMLDEPTSELDPQGRRLVWESIQNDVNGGKCTVIITTHQMEEAATLCDRVIILDHGKVIAAGTPQELVQAHCPGLTLVFKCNRKPDLDRLPGLGLGVTCSETREGVTLRVPCTDFTDAMTRAGAIRTQGELEFNQMAVETKTLEDVFLHLTGRILRD